MVLLPEAEEVAFTVPQPHLRAAFEALAPALCRDETRPVLTGARLTTGLQGVELAAQAGDHRFQAQQQRDQPAQGGAAQLEQLLASAQAHSRARKLGSSG